MEDHQAVQAQAYGGGWVCGATDEGNCSSPNGANLLMCVSVDVNSRLYFRRCAHDLGTVRPRALRIPSCRSVDRRQGVRAIQRALNNKTARGAVTHFQLAKAVSFYFRWRARPFDGGTDMYNDSLLDAVPSIAQ